MARRNLCTPQPPRRPLPRQKAGPGVQHSTALSVRSHQQSSECLRLFMRCNVLCTALCTEVALRTSLALRALSHETHTCIAPWPWERRFCFCITEYFSQISLRSEYGTIGVNGVVRIVSHLKNESRPSDLPLIKESRQIWRSGLVFT